MRDSQRFDFHVAMERHVSIIATEPHSVGSTEHSRVRAYIVAQLIAIGLSPEVQKTTVVKSVRYGWNVKAATVYNILVKIPGTSSSKAIALMAHYDTMPMILEGGMTNESSGISKIWVA